MSEENVEIVRSGYEAFNRGDWDAMFRDMHPDFELTTPPQSPNAGTYRGREECQGFLQDALTGFEAWTVEPEEFFESGDQVVAVYKTRARPKGSSAAIENRNGQLWTIRDGKVQSLRVFPQPRGGPRSRRAAGVGDVGGERGARAPRPPAHERARLRRRG